jgi:hypothetical protein
MASNGNPSKGKNADWKATAEMTTTTWSSTIDAPPSPSQDQDAVAPQHNDKGKAVDWAATASMLTTPRNTEESPRQHREEDEAEAAKLSATIKLIYELDEMETSRANQIRISPRGVPRLAPPPPPPPAVMQSGAAEGFRAIWPKADEAARAGVYAEEEEEEDVHMIDPPGHIEAAAQAQSTMPLRSLKRKKNFPLAPVRRRGLEEEAEVVGSVVRVLDRWECHEVGCVMLLGVLLGVVLRSTGLMLVSVQLTASYRDR